ncbi:MAG: DEAD/DEAH box helicase, partial [Deltaproteobacteria bacterium]|nr:DEAD/DEAH box helicase [Deltaproteobacteria bacterium]
MKSLKDQQFEHMRRLSLPLNLIRGVGPKRAAMLGLKGLNTVLDLFYFAPIRYEDRSKISNIGSVENGFPCLVSGTVKEGKEVQFYPSRKRIYRITISDDDGDLLELLWFRYVKPHLAGLSMPGLKLMVYGTMRISGLKRQMFHPDISIPGRGSKDNWGFVPVYSAVKGVSGNTLRTVIQTSIDDFLDEIIDPMPPGLLDQLRLPDLRTSIRGVHFPPVDTSVELLDRSETPFHRRLVFDRFFCLMLFLAFIKKKKDRISRPEFMIPLRLDKDIDRFFRFHLTYGQRQAVSDITCDFKSGRPMNRMLMGDVGTGKTAVAAIAAYITVMNKRQAAVMAPTQVLARQHMEYFSRLPEGMGFYPVLITGDMKRDERERVYGKVREGEYNLVIGTQSLIREGLIFRDLGLAIIDEQHRFGVRQRAMIDRKGDNPHILFMTATPIPRSLAIALYGDMDVSLVKEYPDGHKPVRTFLVDKPQKKWAFDRLKECVSSGRQAFVICPVIDETEESDLRGAQEMHARI